MNQGSTKYKKLRFPKEFYPNPTSYFTYEPEKNLLRQAFQKNKVHILGHQPN